MKKIIFLSSVAIVSLLSKEIEVGSGTFNIKGGFIGLDFSKKVDIKSVSIVEKHKNIFGSSFFYKYDLNYYRSKDLTTAQKTISGITPIRVAPIKYKYEAVDFNLVLGKDLVYNNNSFVGSGILLGISIPYIDSGSSSSSNNNSNILKALKKSKTKMLTYKIGFNLNGKYEFNKYFSFFVSGSYAYQTAYVKNSYANVDTSANGIYNDFDVNFRFTPFSYKKKVWFFTLNPKFYVSAGFKHSYWKLKNLAIDVTGNNLTFNKTDFTSDINVAYLGVGYDF